jgi:hypothetical protein
MREIRRRYTKSDLVLIGWDSQQKSYNMSKRFSGSKSTSRDPMKLLNGGSKEPLGALNTKIIETDDAYLMPEELNNGVPILKKWFDKEGNLDLRLATGPEAKRYLEALGVPLPPVIRM